MHLFIDTSQAGEILLAHDLNTKWVQHKFLSVQPGNLLAAIQRWLTKLSVHPADVSGLAVRVGVGSFTSIRIAVTVANTLAYAWDIPVVAVKDLSGVRGALRNARPGIYVSASYSGPANIGKRKNL